MRRLMTTGLACLALVACASEDSIAQKDYYQGEQVTPNTGTPGNSVYEPPFQAAEYPAGPYGTNTGSVMANFTFRGWKKPTEVAYDETKFEDMSMADFYDPDGSKGVKVIMLNASAVWCTVCRAEYNKFKNEGTYGKYKAMGAEFISAIFEDAANPPNPSKPADLAWWGSTYQVEFPMVLDPGFKLGQFFTADATPMNLLIDARNMVIIGKYLGGDTTAMFAQLEQHVASY
ncbi:MAG: redoxin domain-containing protein [Polyangiaceae bacterium]